ncbi:MAG: FtsX-like permease family protein [Gammaproteobacteria bacterium]|nr:FtsX-like permease family protein [Gammaproteobacteria bacterium]
MRHWIARQRYLIDYTVAALARRMAKNAGLVAVYTALVFVVASVLLYSHALKREAGFLLQGAPEVVLQKLTAGRHDLVPADYVEKLQGIRGVRSVQGRLWGYYFDPLAAANFTVMVPPDRVIPAGSIVIGEGIARTRGAAEGDVMAMRGSDGALILLRIAEILPRDANIVTADLLLVGEADFRALFGITPGLYTDVVLSVAQPREVRTIAEKVLLRLPDTRPVLREEILRTYEAVFDWREGIVLMLLVGAGLAFVILAWEKASGLSADEQREIGVLKAVGWETGDVLTMKLWEGALVSGFAFLAGFSLAYWHVFTFSAPLFAPVLKGWSVLYPDFRLTPAVDGLQLASLFLFTVVPYVAATLVPVWRAAVTDPDRVMR